jgi:predicted alpha/beta-fold hydrolase
VPKYSLARADEVSPSVQLCYTEDGGHVGFVTARQAGAIGDEMAHFGWMPERVLNFFENR